MKNLIFILALFLVGCNVGVSVNKDESLYEVVRIKKSLVDGDKCVYIMYALNPDFKDVYIRKPCNQYDVGDKLFFTPIEVDP